MEESKTERNPRSDQGTLNSQQDQTPQEKLDNFIKRNAHLIGEANRTKNFKEVFEILPDGVSQQQAQDAFDDLIIAKDSNGYVISSNRRLNEKEQRFKDVLSDADSTEEQKEEAQNNLNLIKLNRDRAQALTDSQNTFKNLSLRSLPGKEEKLADWWKRLPIDQKVAIGAGGAGTLLSILYTSGKKKKDLQDWMMATGLPLGISGLAFFGSNYARADGQYNMDIYNQNLQKLGLKQV